jgi:hypothetical protein
MTCDYNGHYGCDRKAVLFYMLMYDVHVCQELNGPYLFARCKLHNIENLLEYKVSEKEYLVAKVMVA